VQDELQQVQVTLRNGHKKVAGGQLGSVRKPGLSHLGMGALQHIWVIKDYSTQSRIRLLQKTKKSAVCATDIDYPPHVGRVDQLLYAVGPIPCGTGHGR
jgi:hypothetical protein